jgi:hypothetical protein
MAIKKSSRLAFSSSHPSRIVVLVQHDIEKISVMANLTITWEHAIQSNLARKHAAAPHN